MNAAKAIELPPELAERLKARASALGMSVPAYIQFLQDCQEKGLDARFADAAGWVFQAYPRSMKKLSE